MQFVFRRRVVRRSRREEITALLLTKDDIVPSVSPFRLVYYRSEVECTKISGHGIVVEVVKGQTSERDWENE